MDTTIDTNALVDAVGDAVVACDALGHIMLWNPAAERMFGYTQAEALGQSLDIIIPERMRKRHWDGYHETMATGITRYGHDVLRVPAINKANQPLSIAFTVAMLFSPEQTVSSIVAVMRDETARFQQERALRKRIADLEALAAPVSPPGSVPSTSPPAKDDEPSMGGCPFAPRATSNS
jgi:PAS domain S-box-containing protein